MSQHAGAGAVIAALIGTLWVLQYLLNTQYGYMGTGHSLMQYVTSDAHNITEFASEASFIITARFLIAFGISWAPVTAIIAIIKRLI